MKTNRKGIPNEVLHYTETDEYRERVKQRRYLALENFIFVLLCVVTIALSFYVGRVVERHFSIEKASIKSACVVKI